MSSYNIKNNRIHNLHLWFYSKSNVAKSSDNSHFTRMSTKITVAILQYLK